MAKKAEPGSGPSKKAAATARKKVRARHAQASLLLACLIGFVTLTYAAFLPSRDFPLDDSALLQPAQIARGLSLRALPTIFTPGSHVDFYPVRDLSYALDVSLSGDDHRGFHLHQIFLFAALILVLFFMLRALLVPPRLSFAITAMWAAHPMHAEMVCWLSARKDLLAMLLAGLSGLAFIHGVKKRSATLQSLAVLAFLCSVLAKASMALLPWAGVVAAILGFKPLGLRAPELNPRKELPGWQALTVLLLISLTAGIFSNWFYTHVNDIRYFYPWDQRIQSSAAALAKMTGAWLNPNWLVLDPENWGDWLNRQKAFILPGFALWAMIAGSLAWGFIRRDRAMTSFLVALICVYLPISGLLFPHRHFFATRYAEPMFFVVTLGAGVLLSRVRRRMGSTGVQALRSAFAVIFTLLAGQMFQQAKLWSDPTAVIAHALADQPDSTSLKTLRYFDTKARAALKPGDAELETRKNELAAELERLCDPAAHPESERPCKGFWTARFQDEARADPRLATSFLERSLKLAPGDPPSRAQMTIASNLLYQVYLGNLDLETLKGWDFSVNWRTTHELRLLHWLAICMSVNEAAARTVAHDYLDRQLLLEGHFRNFHDFANPKYRARMKSCFLEPATPSR